MIGILSHIVEFRNSESAQHVLQVQTVTEMLLRKLTEKTDVYGLTEEKIRLITTASALHDIGKISIPESILNKAGALTPEEFNIIRTIRHRRIHARGLTQYRDEPLVKSPSRSAAGTTSAGTAAAIPPACSVNRSISAQVVALADVFDALTSDRCYKKAYTHDTAITAVLNGECGAFSDAARLPAGDQHARREHCRRLPPIRYSTATQRLSAELLQKSDVPPTTAPSAS